MDKIIVGEASRQTTDRAAALAAYAVMDTPAESGFDDLAFIASQVCAAPVALVSLLGEDRQWFKASVGFDLCETPLTQSICAYALGGRELFQIPDLALDPRTADNPLVVTPPHMRFYAGAPLVTPAGVAIGTLCVMDQVPRPDGLAPRQATMLAALARQVITQLELRQRLQFQQIDTAAAEAETLSLREAYARQRISQEAAALGTFEIDVATGEATVSDEVCRIFGFPQRTLLRMAEVERLVVPEDRHLCSDDLARRRGELALDVEYRIRRADDGRLRWISRRGEFVRDVAGVPTTLLGIVEDVTDRHRLQDFQAGLLELGDRLRLAPTSADVVATAAEVLGRGLGASRTGYAQIDGARATVERDWTAAGVASLAGSHALPALGIDATAAQTGAPRVVADTLRDDAGGPSDARARLDVPLVEDGALVGLLYAHQRDVRPWDAHDVAFASSVADRTYAALGKVRAETDQRLLNQELSHRLKNTLAMVQAIARQTLHAVKERGPVEAFEKRIFALSSAHDVLLQQSWAAARMHSVVEAVLRTFDLEARCTVAGPDLSLGPRATLGLSLLLHELTTNAMKYGSLSVEGGTARIDWVLEGPDADMLRLRWRERDGPPSSKPERTGFGARIIAMGLGGTGGAETIYAPAGFEASFVAPLQQVQQS